MDALLSNKWPEWPLQIGWITTGPDLFPHRLDGRPIGLLIGLRFAVALPADTGRMNHCDASRTILAIGPDAVKLARECRHLLTGKLDRNVLAQRLPNALQLSGDGRMAALDLAWTTGTEERTGRTQREGFWCRTELLHPTDSRGARPSRST